MRTNLQSPATYSNICSLLESVTTRQQFYFSDNQSFKDKYISFQFEHPVWVNKIEFLLYRSTTWTLHFTWEYSDDGGEEHWKQIGYEYFKPFSTTKDPQFVEPYEILTLPQEMKQERKTKHKYWRVHGLGGQVTASPYVNVVFINLTL